jgi:hypothetical protein
MAARLTLVPPELPPDWVGFEPELERVCWEPERLLVLVFKVAVLKGLGVASGLPRYHKLVNKDWIKVGWRKTRLTADGYSHSIVVSLCWKGLWG